MLGPAIVPPVRRGTFLYVLQNKLLGFDRRFSTLVQLCHPPVKDEAVAESPNRDILRVSEVNEIECE